MKTLKFNALLLAGVLGLTARILAQPADLPPSDPPPEEIMPIPIEAAVELIEAFPLLDADSNMVPTEANGAPTGDGTGTPGTNAYHRDARAERARLAPLRGTEAPGDASFATPPTAPDNVVKDGERGLRLNFRGAPLELVLNYLSDAAGYIIVAETDIRGKVDIVSNQPLTKDEAVDLLSVVLSKNGYSVLRDGRTLTIVTKDEARKRDIPVKTGYEPANIPKNDQIVTQIIPVRFINAVQLARDLAPLIPSSATLTANEGGNALVITDAQTSIRRMAEIIKALDTTVSSLSSVKVFPLRYADAKTVADMLKEVFATTDSGRGSSRGEFRFGGFSGFGGGDRGASSPSSTGGRPGAAKVVATADERSNSLVVSAPDDLMPTIEELVASVDTNVEDVTEIRVFRLQHADPQETADLLASLFPDPTAQSNQRGGDDFRRFFREQAAGGNAATATSERMKKQTKVTAVPDNRTRSVVVTAARDTMTQITTMLEQLDSDPARKQKVFVFNVENTDPTTVQATLQDLFSGQGTTGTRARTTTGQAGTQLNTRAQQQNQNTTGNRNNNTGAFGNTGNRSFGN